MKLLPLAIRNLLRNRRRSLATLLAITIGVTSILLFGGYKADIKYALQTGFVRSGGHLQIQHRDFFLFGSGNPIAYAIGDYARIVDAIRADPALKDLVTVVTPTLQFGGIAGNHEAGVSRTVIGNGFVASDHTLMRAWNSYGIALAAPPLLLDKAPANAAIVGVGLARVLQLCSALGIEDCPQPEREKRTEGASLPAEIAELTKLDSAATKAGKVEAKTSRASGAIDLLTSGARGTPNVASIDVVGAENQGFKEYDEIYVLLHLGQAQRLVYGSSQPKASTIIVQLRDTASTDAAMARIAEQLKGWSGNQPLAVRDFKMLNPFYVQSVQLFDTIFGFMFALIGGIVMFTVANTMNTAVVERTVEIGTLRAMGLRQGGISWLFVAEGTLLGIVGAVVGAIVALVVAFAINHMGLEWRPPASAASVPLTLKVWGESGMLIGTTVGLMAVTTFSAWWPARRAATLKIVEALRHV